MKKLVMAATFAGIALFLAISDSTANDQATAQTVSVLDEKVNHLSAQMDDVQFRYQQLQKTLDGIQSELKDLRHSAGGVSAEDLKALDTRIQAVDTARKADRQAIIDQLAKELANMGSGKPSGKTPAPSHDASPAAGGSADASEHVVTKGETLSLIAKNAGVTVADLRKANNLTSNEIKVGQKLTIPK